MSCEIGPGICVELWIGGSYSNLYACQNLSQEKKKSTLLVIITYQMQHSAR